VRLIGCSKTKTTYYAANTDREFSAAWQFHRIINYFLMLLLDWKPVWTNALAIVGSPGRRNMANNIQNIQFTFNQWNIEIYVRCLVTKLDPKTRENQHWLNRTMILWSKCTILTLTVLLHTDSRQTLCINFRSYVTDLINSRGTGLFDKVIPV
jgi:hypothetical protein